MSSTELLQRTDVNNLLCCICSFFQKFCPLDRAEETGIRDQTQCWEAGRSWLPGFIECWIFHLYRLLSLLLQALR